MPKIKTIFVTGTDTGIGKTVVTLCLGVLLKDRGLNVGIMKPVQCAGYDAQLLKKALGLVDDLRLINPFYAPEPLSPHLAFQRSKIKFDRQHIKDYLKELQRRYDIGLVEGAGGLMVPITDTYYNADLIADLKAEVVIVARLGLGTINHTLLTINELRQRKLKIKGIVFCQTRAGRQNLPETTNPQEIARLSGIKVLGTIPYLKLLTLENIRRQCRTLALHV